jgi:hypothetical protein
VDARGYLETKAVHAHSSTKPGEVRSIIDRGRRQCILPDAASHGKPATSFFPENLYLTDIQLLTN